MLVTGSESRVVARMALLEILSAITFSIPSFVVIVVSPVIVVLGMTSDGVRVLTVVVHGLGIGQV